MSWSRAGQEEESVGARQEEERRHGWLGSNAGQDILLRNGGWPRRTIAEDRARCAPQSRSELKSCILRTFSSKKTKIISNKGLFDSNYFNKGHSSD
jgi:hypothetical protein